MSFESYRQRYADQLKEIQEAGLWKREREIITPQRPRIEILEAGGTGKRAALNLCANNYLGLADNDEIIESACRAARDRGFGMASVRFICGTQDLHRQLEAAIARFLGMDDTILYSSCFDANGGLFETLLGAEDAVITDELNHASIIDGVRLSKAARRIFKHSDMTDLRAALRETASARVRMIVTDGVFSMHGDLARLPDICELADAHSALVVVDDSHATGFVGARGRGTHEHFGVEGRVDIITSTLGKALGGGSGGFTSGRSELVGVLRQRSRPYLFSNSVPPPVAAAALKALEIVEREPERLERLRSNTRFFRQAMAARGFTISPGEHPIVPILLGDERKTVALADDLLRRGLYVVGFTYPVVPKGQARIRVQVSAAHSREDLEEAVRLFAEGAAACGILGRSA
ncbi:MAG TPA: glycine C-acetyltransferase [Planctomycetota bacterium]|nr:glycine C-acetyltransferase [Planctomycetota bacterium]